MISRAVKRQVTDLKKRSGQEVPAVSLIHVENGSKYLSKR